MKSGLSSCSHRTAVHPPAYGGYMDARRPAGRRYLRVCQCGMVTVCFLPVRGSGTDSGEQGWLTKVGFDAVCNSVGTGRRRIGWLVHLSTCHVS